MSFNKLVSIATFHLPMKRCERPASPQALRKWSKYGGPRMPGPSFPPDCRPKSRIPKPTLPKVSIQGEE